MFPVRAVSILALWLPPIVLRRKDTSCRILDGVVTGVRDFLAASKAATIRGFWGAVGGGGEVVVGGEAIIKFAAANLVSGGDGNSCFLGTVLIDAEDFVDDIGPIPSLSVPLDQEASSDMW